MMGRVVVILGGLAATAGLIGLLQGWFGFPPLILFAVPIAACLRIRGTVPAFVLPAIAAVIGDYFFVQPVGEVTVHAQGLRLLVWLCLGTWIVSFVVRRRTA